MLIGSLYTNAMATTIEAHEKIEILNNVSQYFNTNQFSHKNIISNYQKYNPEKAKELNAFFEAHPEAKKIQIPEVKIEQGRLSSLIKGQKIYFSLIETGRFTISSDSASVSIDNSMNSEKIFEILTTHFKPLESFTVFNLFISEANAQVSNGVVVVALIIFNILMVTMLTVSDKQSRKWENLVGEVEKIDYMCRGSETNGDDSELSDLKNAYSKLTEIELSKCQGSFFRSMYEENKLKPLCRKMQLIKKCIKTTIDRIERKGVNNSARGNAKKVQYDSHEDKFTPKSMSK